MRPRKLILVVDSDPIRRSVLKVVLETRGQYLVYKARCAYEALEVLQYLPIQTVLTDLNLRGSDGNELARRIKQNWNGVRVILYTESGRFFSQRDTVADLFLPGSHSAIGPLLGWVALSTKLKRGPKKKLCKPVRPVPAVARRAA